MKPDNGRIVQVPRRKSYSVSPRQTKIDATHKKDRIPRTVQVNGSLARTTDYLIQVLNFPDASASTVAIEAKANQ
jgi:hypothetical protein